MFKHFFKKSNDDDIFETVDPIVEQRRNEKFSKPLIYDEEFKKEEVTKKSEGQQVSKETTSKNVKKVEKKVEKKEEPEIKKNYEMMDIISPMFGMHEEKKEIVKTVKKNSVKKPKKKDNSLVQVISPYYGNFEEKEETDSEAVLTAVEDSKDFQDETNTDAEKTIEDFSKDYPEIKKQEVIIDNMCMQLVLRPETFDVLVAPNLYGDIVSDLCAGLVGGLGFAPSGNIGDEYRIYEAVHGSAPDIAGQGIANPSALLLAFALMLEALGQNDQANRLRDALSKVVEEGKIVTCDIGGHASTKEFTQAIIDRL